MNDINTTGPEVKAKSPFVILQKPKTPESLVIPERKLEEKRFEAISELKYNGEIVPSGTILRITDKDVYDHFIRYGSIKEVL